MGYFEERIPFTEIFELAAELMDESDEFGRIGDGIDGARRETRMRGRSIDGYQMGCARFVPKDQLHIGRLSNNAESRLYRKLSDTVDKAQHTCTTQLLVIGDGNVDRHLEIATG